MDGLNPISGKRDTPGGQGASFGQWLKRQRKEYGYTQDELARRVGCSVVTIQRIEEGVRRPSRQLAELIAEGLEIPSQDRLAFVQWARRQSPRISPHDEHPVDGPVTEGEERGAAMVPAANPYKGLSSFSEADAPIFFGREVLTSRMVARLAEPVENAHFLAVVGPSGSGKSSAVRAGLVPALRHFGLPGGSRPVVVDMIPGSHPMEELEAGLLHVAANPPPSLVEQLQAGPRGLLRAVKRVLPTPSDANTALLLFIDQFEEVFTLVQDDAVRLDFLNSLYTSFAEPGSPLWIVVTLRADFFDRPLVYDRWCELLGQRTELVGPMSPEELHRAIAAPAEWVGVAIEPALELAIQRDMGDQPGTLPLMEYALTELFEQREGGVLTLAAYRATGGVHGALGRRADAIYVDLAPAEQEETRRLFQRLVTLGEGVEDTRRRVIRAELASAARDEEALDRALEAFGRYRLLTFDRDLITHGPTVEIAHEALLKSWLRLRDWLDTSRADLRTQRQLMVAGSEWAGAGRDPSFLATGSRLAQFVALVEGADRPGGVALTAEEQTYVRVSVEERERKEAAERERQAHELELARQQARAQQSAANRLRVLVGGMVVFLLAIAVLAVFAFGQQAEATTARQVAQTNYATAVASEALARDNAASAQAELANSEAQRLAAEANTLLQAHGSAEVIGLLSLLSMKTRYSPQGDAALAGAAMQDYPRQVFAGHSDAVWDVAFSPDGKYLLTAGGDNTARMWDIVTGKEVRRFTGHTDAVIGVAFSPDAKQVATCGHDKTTRVWDSDTGAQLRLFTAADGVWSCVFSPDGKYVLTGGVDKMAHLWDVASGLEVRRFVGHTDVVYGVAFSPDGKYVLTAGTGDKTARMWDASTGKEVRRFTGDISGVVLVAFSPDSKYVLASSWDKIAHMWDAQTGVEVRRFVGHTYSTKGVMFSPDGRTVLTSADDTTARLWDFQTGLELRRLIGHTSAVYAAVFSPDGRYIATASADKTALLWDSHVITGLPQYVGHTDTINAFDVAFSPDGKYVLTGSFDKTARLWDAQTGQEIRRFVGHTDHVTSVAFSPDGKSIVTGSDDKTIRIWDVQTGVEVRRLSHGDQGFDSAVFSHDSKYILAAGPQTPLMWNAQTGAKVREFTGHTAPAWSVAFSPDDRFVLTASVDKTARLWDTQTGQEVRSFTGHTEAVKDAAFSPDGTRVLTCSDDKSARLWDTQSGRQVQIFVGHTDRVSGCAFSPDGKYVLTGSDDKTARLWDVQTGREVRRFTGHADGVISVAYSPDGKTVLTGSADKTARLWNVDYHDTMAYICSRLVRDFSDDERKQYNITGKTTVCR